MCPFLLIAMEQQDTRQEIQERMGERSCESYPSTNEQRRRPFATVAQQSSILPDPFGRQCHQRNCLCFRWISDLMLFTMRQKNEIASSQGNALGVEAQPTAPRDDHMKAGAILDRERQTPRGFELAACIKAA